MITISQPIIEDIDILESIARQSFIESHGHSASAEIINTYIQQKFSKEALAEELNHPENIFRIIYYNKQPAGYSKIVFNIPQPAIQEQNITKLERLYLLKEFYHLKLGYKLLQHSIELSTQHGQAGMWLFVWKENQRAFDFYKRAGFVIAGEYDFKLSETHSNPNYQMYLRY